MDLPNFSALTRNSLTHGRRTLDDVSGSGIGRSRRSFLGLATAGLGASAGCLNRIRRTADREEPTQVSIEILTLPEDEDHYGIRVGNYLAENLRAVGVDVDVVPRRHEAFLRQILINQNFDLYIWRQPPQDDPDVFRPLFHSRFSDEPGWQNPFGYSNSLLDGLLETQLIAEETSRTETIEEIQDAIVNERPYIPIGFETDNRLYRNDRLEVPRALPMDDPTWILGIRPADEIDDESVSYTLGTTDWRLTHNLNPLAVEYRGGNGIVELLYEPIERQWGPRSVPWLAESWEWTSRAGARSPTIEVRLRDDLRWHDGESITSADVVFTYRFLNDTTMTDDDPVVPTLRYRGRASLLDSVESVDERRVRIQFVPSTRGVARRLLTVPILPEHIWEGHTDLTDVAGVTIADATTDAMVIDNLDPVGSGPFVVDDVSTDDYLDLREHPGHFLHQDRAMLGDVDLDVDRIENIRIDIRPSVSNIVNAIEDGTVDASLRDLGSQEADGSPDGVAAISEERDTVFHIGFNMRRFPLTNYAFREVLARLLDRTYLAEEVFDGNIRPVLSPMYNEDLVPPSLTWSPERSTFEGEPGTGEIDSERIRERFRDGGFQFTEDGDLLSR